MSCFQSPSVQTNAPADMPTEPAFPLWILLPGLLLVLYGGSLVWVYRDARRRGHQPWHAVLLVMTACWPLSLSLWLMIRSRRALAPKGYGTAWG